MKKLAVFVSGSGTNLQAIIDKVESGYIPDASIEVVISNKKTAYALERARNHNIDAIFLNPKDYKDENKEKSRIRYDRVCMDILEDYKIDYVILAGYMRLLSKEFVSKWNMKILNIHPAILPAFPGIDAQQQAINYGVQISGATVHFVDEFVDHGPVILQAFTPIFPEDTREDFTQRNLRREHFIFPEAIRLVTSNLIKIENRRVEIIEEKFYERFYGVLINMLIEDLKNRIEGA